MFKNLIDLLKSKEISTKDFANTLGTSEKTAHNKLYGITEFTFSEIQTVCKVIFPEYNVDYLFRSYKKAS